MLQEAFNASDIDEVRHEVDLDAALFADMGEDLDAAAPADAVTPEVDLIDTIFSRFMPNFTGDDDPNAQAELPREIMDAVAAIKQTQQFAPETVKLESASMTTSGELGAQAAENYINGKADAIHHAKAGLQELKTLQADMAAAGKTTAAQDAAAQGPGMAGIAGGAVAGGIVAAAAGAVSKTLGNMVSGGGTLNTIFQSATYLRSGLESDTGYGHSAGHSTVDLTQSNRAVVDVMDWDKQEMLGDIQLVEDFMLDELGLPLTPEALDTIEAQLMEMQVDTQLGADAFRNWEQAPMALAEVSGEIDPALIVTPAQMAALTLDAPELDMDDPTPAARPQTFAMA